MIDWNIIGEGLLAGTLLALGFILTYYVMMDRIDKWNR